MIPVQEYPARYQRYLDLVSEDSILEAYDHQEAVRHAILSRLSPEQESFRYARDKWTCREVVGHLIDVERIFSLRVMRFSREDSKPRQDFDFDKTEYVVKGRYEVRSLQNLTSEFDHIRKSNIIFFGALDAEQMTKVGTANNDNLSVRALLYIILGHERHHLNMIEKLYLSS